MDNIATCSESIVTEKIKFINREINHQAYHYLLEQGESEWVAKIFSGRMNVVDLSKVHQLAYPKLAYLEQPDSLKDFEKAVARIAIAILNQEIIGIETDHDCDGQTSHAVIYSALVDYFGHPKNKVQSYIGHRLEEGYGLSEKLAQRILSPDVASRCTLVITADNGSSDEPRIALLASHGIDVIVTDHHEIPSEGIPQSAYAVLNPTRFDSDYVDNYIAGCMVAWLLMTGVRKKLEALQHKSIPSLAGLLDFVACGTVADCVSMANSVNNRAIVKYGMQLIEQGLRPCWRAILPQIEAKKLMAVDLGFKIGPLLNSDGRLNTAMGSVSFLLAETDELAHQWLDSLKTQNEERKKIQQKITFQAQQLAEKELIQTQFKQKSLCLFIDDSHAGVHGISASRIKDLYGRPTILFTPKLNESELLSGSARNIDGLHLRQALQQVYDRRPECIKAFGGHKGAAGLTIHRKYFDLFKQLFEEVIEKQVLEQGIEVGPKIIVDGEINIEKLSLTYFKQGVYKLEPFGREFEIPVYYLQAKTVTVQNLGQSGLHARVLLQDTQGKKISMVWFNYKKSPEADAPVSHHQTVELAFQAGLNHYQGNESVQFQIVGLNVLKSEAKF
jgi:single-stranded-DNA-specific exonuclease